MKTDELIAALAADTQPQPPVALHLTRAILVAACVSVAAFALFWGPRADLGAAFASFAALKTLVPLVLMLSALPFALALAQPGVLSARRAAALGGVITLAVLAFLTALGLQGLDGLASALRVPGLLTCLMSIPALAVPLLAATLWGLSAGAVLRPALTGAVAGLAAGGLAAAIYSIYCDEDTVLFVLSAYPTAIALVALAGAVLGPRALRW
jgi:hypothetical protein